MIAIDEAYLFTEWSDFRSAFSELKKLKSEFPAALIMALTATATANVENDINLLLRNAITSKSSLNRPNITLNVEKLAHDNTVPLQFSLQRGQYI